jgi:hypothetical protein
MIPICAFYVWAWDFASIRFPIFIKAPSFCDNLSKLISNCDFSYFAPTLLILMTLDSYLLADNYQMVHYEITAVQSEGRKSCL